MKCPKCQTEMDEEQRICGKCGWERHHFPGGVNTLDEKKVPVLSTQKNTFMQNQMSSQIPISNSQRDLLDVFIGPNSEKIKKGGFNFAAFFFGCFYCCYRKLYLFAILFYLICKVIGTVLELIIPLWLLLPIHFSFSLILGFAINKFYVNHANKKIEQIRRKILI